MAVADRDEDEAVTPAMIEAGELVLYRYHPERGLSAADVVIQIYRSMRTASAGSAEAPSLPATFDVGGRPTS